MAYSISLSKLTKWHLASNSTIHIPSVPKKQLFCTVLPHGGVYRVPRYISESKL